MFFSKISKSNTLIYASSIYGKVVGKNYLLRLRVPNSTPIILNETDIQCDRFRDSGYHFVRAYSASSLPRLRADQNEDLESGGDANHKDASLVKEILKSYDSGSKELEAALEGEMLDITEDLVVQVLRRHRSDWKPALSFFNWVTTRQGYAHGPRAYNEMFDILGKMKQFKLMQQMMDEIPKERATSIINNKTFAVMVNRYAAAHKVQEAIDVFYKRRDYGFELDLVGFQILLTSLCRYKHVEEAESLFLKQQRQFPPVIRSRNIILNGWCALGRSLEAKRFWNDIISSKCQPDLYTYGIFINSLTKTGNLESAVKLFASMWEKGCHPDVTICNCIIDALCSSNRIPEALEIFKEMDEPGCLPDVVTYNTLIKHLCNIGKMKKVYELLAAMEQKSCLPNAVTFSYILKTTTNPDEVSEVLQRMEKTGCRLNGDTYNLILNLYVGWKYQKGIKFIWADMEENGFGPDQRSYTIMIHGLHSLGKLDKALQYYTEMRSKGMIPEERTMVLVKAMHMKREESSYKRNN